MSNFADLFQRRCTPVIHQAHGVSGTYSPANGGQSSTGTVTVNHTGIVLDQDGGLSDVEELLITVQRQASDENPGVLVIEDPQLRDGFRIDSEPDGKGFAFTGEIPIRSELRWQLRFTRRIPSRQGGNTRLGK